MANRKVPQSLAHIIKREARKGAFHSLTLNQRIIMRQKGFLAKEVKEFDQNTTTEFTSTHFQHMMRSRAKYAEAMKLNGWTASEIRTRIIHFLNKKGASPWDFFRLEYTTVLQRPTLSGSQFARFLAERRDISRHFGRAYGRIQSVQKHFYKGLPGLPRKRS